MIHHMDIIIVITSFFVCTFITNADNFATNIFAYGINPMNIKAHNNRGTMPMFNTIFLAI